MFHSGFHFRFQALLLVSVLVYGTRAFHPRACFFIPPTSLADMSTIHCRVAPQSQKFLRFPPFFYCCENNDRKLSSSTRRSKSTLFAAKSVENFSSPRKNGISQTPVAESASELLQMWRRQKVAEPRASALQKIAGYVAPPADVEAFQLNWVGNVDTHQRKLFWGLIEMLCERLTVPFLIMMGVHNTIMAAHRTYRASCQALISTAAAAVATTSVASSILFNQCSHIASSWSQHLPSAASTVSEAATSCALAARSAVPSAAVSSMVLATGAARLAGDVSSAAVAVANMSLVKVRDMVWRWQGQFAASAPAPPNAANSRTQQHLTKPSSAAQHRAIQTSSPTKSLSSDTDALLSTDSLAAAIRAERDRRRQGRRRVRVHRQAQVEGGDAHSFGWGAAAMRKAWDTVLSTDVLIVF